MFSIFSSGFVISGVSSAAGESSGFLAALLAFATEVFLLRNVLIRLRMFISYRVNNGRAVCTNRQRNSGDALLACRPLNLSCLTVPQGPACTGVFGIPTRPLIGLSSQPAAVSRGGPWRCLPRLNGRRNCPTEIGFPCDRHAGIVLAWKRLRSSGWLTFSQVSKRAFVGAAELSRCSGS